MMLKRRSHTFRTWRCAAHAAAAKAEIHIIWIIQIWKCQRKKLKLTKCILCNKIKDRYNAFFSPLSYDLLLPDHYLIKHLLWVGCCHEVARFMKCPDLAVCMWHESESSINLRRSREECKLILAVEWWWLQGYLNPFILATVSQHFLQHFPSSSSQAFHSFPTFLHHAERENKRMSIDELKVFVLPPLKNP